MEPRRYEVRDAATSLEQLAREVAAEGAQEVVLTDSEGEGIAVLMGIETLEQMEERISILENERDEARGTLKLTPIEEIDASDHRQERGAA